MTEQTRQVHDWRTSWTGRWPWSLKTWRRLAEKAEGGRDADASH